MFRKQIRLSKKSVHLVVIAEITVHLASKMNAFVVQAMTPDFKKHTMIKTCGTLDSFAGDRNQHHTMGDAFWVHHM